MPGREVWQRSCWARPAWLRAWHRRWKAERTSRCSSYAPGVWIRRRFRCVAGFGCLSRRRRKGTRRRGGLPFASCWNTPPSFTLAGCATSLNRSCGAAREVQMATVGRVASQTAPMDHLLEESGWFCHGREVFAIVGMVVGVPPAAAAELGDRTGKCWKAGWGLRTGASPR